MNTKKEYIKLIKKKKNLQEKISVLNEDLKHLKDAEASMIANEIEIILDKEDIDLFELLNLIKEDNSNKLN